MVKTNGRGAVGQAVNALVQKCRRGQCDAYDMGRLRGLTSVADRLGHGEDLDAVIRLAEQSVRDDYDAGYLAGLKEAAGDGR